MRRRLVALLVCLAGCAPPPAHRAPETTPATEPDAEATATPRPEAGAMRLLQLEVPGFLPAIAAVPEVERRVPVVVAAHGAGGNPEWQCQHWASIVRARALVLCPRGRRISLRAADDGAFYYPNHLELEREVVSMLSAARLQLGSWLGSGPGIYTGFSQGATMGALMIVDHADRFPFLLLIEGATSEFSPRSAKRFAAGGGKSVAFVCGGRHCAAGAERMTQVLRRAGLEARAEYVPHGGHTDDGAVGERAREIFEELLAAASAAGE